MINYKFICQELWNGIGFYNLDDFQIKISNSFNRVSNSNTESLINDQKIKLIQQADKKLYNEPKFRLHSIAKVGNKILINLGFTDYFDYLTTNHNLGLNSKLIKMGTEQYSDPDIYLSNALGNVAIVKLIDDKIILLKRSINVQTYVGYYDLPGGHPEPSQLTDIINFNNIAKELFDSIKRELIEELNIKNSDIIDIRNIGFLRSLEDGRKPEMLFFVPVNISSDDVKHYYKNHQDEFNESTGIVFYDINELSKINLKMTAVTLGTISLFLENKDLIHE